MLTSSSTSPSPGSVIISSVMSSISPSHVVIAFSSSSSSSWLALPVKFNGLIFGNPVVPDTVDFAGVARDLRDIAGDKPGDAFFADEGAGELPAPLAAEIGVRFGVRSSVLVRFELRLGVVTLINGESRGTFNSFSPGLISDCTRERGVFGISGVVPSGVVEAELVLPRSDKDIGSTEFERVCRVVLVVGAGGLYADGASLDAFDSVRTDGEGVMGELSGESVRDEERTKPLTGADFLRELVGSEGILLGRREETDTEALLVDSPLVDNPFESALFIFCGVMVVASLIKEALDDARGLWIAPAVAEDLREIRDGASEGGRFVECDMLSRIASE
jgi:hypothetical protein